MTFWVREGEDLTHWKSTIVRRLMWVEAHEGELVNREPFTLTFYVQGEPRVVKTDADGFSYAGERHERPGLTDLALLQGVP